MEKDVVKTRPRVPDELLERISKQDTATMHEAMGRRGAMTHEIKPIDTSMRLCGRALTVKCQSGDNLMLIRAVKMAEKGDVIVADMGAILDNAPFGEVLCVECQTKQMAGIVLNCSVRDTAALVRKGFPVFSAGVNVTGTVKCSKGIINHAIVCSGTIVRPGDVILGDRDGVVVIPYEEVEAAVCAAEERIEKEKRVMKRLAAGESLFDIYHYQEVYDTLKIIEEVL